MYPIQKGGKYDILILDSLNQHGKEFDLFNNQGMSSVFDQFEYIMNGKIFEDKIEEQKEGDKVVRVT